MAQNSNLHKLDHSNTRNPFDEASAATNKELTIHRWTKWIAGFSGEFVQSAINRYLPCPKPDDLVLDPFTGVGTTLVEAYRKGIGCVGFEINPFAALVTKVKLQAIDIDVEELKKCIERYIEYMRKIEYAKDICCNVPNSIAPPGFHSHIPFFSKSIEKCVLFTLDYICELPATITDIFRIALGSVLVEFSNYTYEPSLGSRPGAGKALIEFAPVGNIMSKKLQNILEDIVLIQNETKKIKLPISRSIYQTSYFNSNRYISPNSVSLVVTSPPYMNNYHYVRNTRPQLYWIALANSVDELKHIEEENFGKYWQTVRSKKKIELEFSLPELEQQIEEIRLKNPNKGVYGGNGWANYVSVYMNDLYRFVGILENQLRANSGVAVVVLGNSIIQGVHIPVEKYTAKLAEMCNLDIERTDILRSRVGSSIVNSGTRLNGELKYRLYDFAIVIRR